MMTAVALTALTFRKLKHITLTVTCHEWCSSRRCRRNMLHHTVSLCQHGSCFFVTCTMWIEVLFISRKYYVIDLALRLLCSGAFIVFRYVYTWSLSTGKLIRTKLRFCLSIVRSAQLLKNCSRALDLNIRMLGQLYKAKVCRHGSM